MKNIKEFGCYELDGKSVLLVGNEYNGNPLIMWKYDILLCSIETYNRYKNQLVCDQLVKQGWSPNVRFI